MVRKSSWGAGCPAPRAQHTRFRLGFPVFSRIERMLDRLCPGSGSARTLVHAGGIHGHVFDRVLEMATVAGDQPVTVRQALACNPGKGCLDLVFAHRDRRHATQLVSMATPVFGQYAIPKKIGGDLDVVVAITCFPEHALSPLIAGKPAKIGLTPSRALANGARARMEQTVCP